MVVLCDLTLQGECSREAEVITVSVKPTHLSLLCHKPYPTPWETETGRAKGQGEPGLQSIKPDPF